MSTPICAGIVALIKESDPNLKPDEIKNVLMTSTDLWNDPKIYPPIYTVLVILMRLILFLMNKKNIKLGVLDLLCYT